MIRPANAADMPALCAVIDTTGMFPSDMLPPMMAGYLSGEAPADHWFTYDQDGPVAVLYYAPERMTAGTWNMYLIAVRPSHQRSGVGSALVRHVEQALRAGGERILLVETSNLPEFARARAFYLKNDYVIEARIRDFYADGEDKVVFRKSLVAG